MKLRYATFAILSITATCLIVAFSLILVVRDSSIGIAPDRLNQLFQSFTQLDNSTTRRYGGTGLGLAISKRLTEMMNASYQLLSVGMEVLSANSGRAALLALEKSPLPNIVVLDMQRPPESLNVFACLVKPIKINQLSLVLSNALGDPEQLTQPQKIAVTQTTVNNDSGTEPRPGKQCPLVLLLVEDNPVNQKVGLLLLGKLGYQADVGSNGQEQAARQIHIHFGAEQRPYIIAMTANAVECDREKYLNGGMDAFISKPVKIEALKSVLTAAYYARLTE